MSAQGCWCAHTRVQHERRSHSDDSSHSEAQPAVPSSEQYTLNYIATHCQGPHTKTCTCNRSSAVCSKEPSSSRCCSRCLPAPAAMPAVTTRGYMWRPLIQVSSAYDHWRQAQGSSAASTTHATHTAARPASQPASQPAAHLQVRPQCSHGLRRDAAALDGLTQHRQPLARVRDGSEALELR